MKTENDGAISDILSELQDIKKLMVLALMRNGTSQKQIAHALQVNQSSISRMFPKGLEKPFVRRNDEKVNI